MTHDFRSSQVTSQVRSITENGHVIFADNSRTERLEQKFGRHRVPFVGTNINMYLLAPKGQGQKLTSGHVTSRSNWVKMGKHAHRRI